MVGAGVDGVEGVGVEVVIGGSFRWGWGWGNGWFLFGSMVGKWTGVKGDLGVICGICLVNFGTVDCSSLGNSV